MAAGCRRQLRQQAFKRMAMDTTLSTTTLAPLPTIAELLEPANLSRLTGTAITSVRCEPLRAEFAHSGSRILRVITDAGHGPRLVLKCVSLEWDWLMRATEDTHCRSVTLWQHGLFERMPDEIEHGVLACAHEGNQWAILMRDFGEALVANRPFTVADNKLFLDAMAALHAAFWNDPALRAPALGLCTARHVYGMFSPHTGRRESGGSDELPRRILEGWDVALSLIDRGLAREIEALLDDPTPLCAALGRSTATLIHGDWRHANQGLVRTSPGRSSPQVVMFDWQLAAAAPPAVELGRYLGANSALLPGRKEDSLDYYRARLETRLGTPLAAEQWRSQLALGLLGGFVQDGWAIALKATTWHVGADARDHWRADLAWWAEQAREGMKVLVLAENGEE